MPQNMDIKDFCQKIPKLELHAHLNGSLSGNTLTALGMPTESWMKYQLKKQCNTNSDQLSQCFNLFKIAHAATSTIESVYTATRHVIEEFAKENVIYLELRTTPRSEDGMTKQQYLEAVVQAIRDDRSGILVKLTPSIDRSHSTDISDKSLELILKMFKKHPDIITGIDLCGNPSKGSFDKGLFQKARDCGLKVTLHCAEVENHTEVIDILKFKPDRIGHGTFIHPLYGGSEELWQLYTASKVPTECCLSSNVLCGTSKGYQYHHVQEWKKNGLPFVLNTDDKGVFSTTLWEEFYYAAEYLDFTKTDIYECCLRAVQFSFTSTEEKLELEKALLPWKC